MRRARAAEQQQQCSRAAEQQISITAEQQNSRTAEQQSSRAAEQQHMYSRTAEQQTSRTTAAAHLMISTYSSTACSRSTEQHAQQHNMQYPYSSMKTAPAQKNGSTAEAQQQYSHTQDSNRFIYLPADHARRGVGLNLASAHGQHGPSPFGHGALGRAAAGELCTWEGPMCS